MTETTTKELTPLQEEINKHHNQCHSLIISNNEQMESAQNVLLAINITLKKVREEYDPLCTKAYVSWEALTETRRKHKDPLEAAKKVISQKIGQYQLKLEEEAKAEKRKLREEAEAKERERQLAEKKKLEDKKLEQAEFAFDMGQKESVEDILNEPIKVKPKAIAALVPPPVSASVLTPAAPSLNIPKKKGLSYRNNWTWELIDEDDLSQIPDYLKIVTINKQAVNALVKAQKNNCKIPGIRVFNNKTAVQRV